MPAYNAARFLDESIPSILNQTFNNFEFIIVDDCSTDDTPSVIKKYADLDSRIIYLRNATRMDHLECRNIALRHARGIYVAELDADDIALPHRLESQYQYCLKHPALALVGGGVEIINDQGLATGHKRPSENFNVIKYKLLLRNPFVHSAIFYKKDIIKKVGGYDPEYLHAEDYALYWRLIENDYRLGNVPEIIIKYRYHNQSISTVSNTRTIQLENAYKISWHCINQYVPISPHNTKLIIDTIHKRNQSISAIIRTIFFCKKLTVSYLKREKVDGAEKKDIWNIYTKEKEMLLGQAVRAYLPFLYKISKKTYQQITN